MLEKNLLKEMLGEYKEMAEIINRRISILERMLGQSNISMETLPNNTFFPSIQQEIDKRRQEIMSEVQNIKNSAEAQIQMAKQMGAVPNIPQMPFKNNGIK